MDTITPLSHILIVDDEQVHRQMVSDILSTHNHVVLAASSGQEALDMIGKHPIDTVLLDKNMPGMDGYETCRRIRHELKQEMLPIIMVTGDGGPTHLAGSLDIGATDFIQKPFHPVELRSRVGAAVKIKKTTDQLDNTESILFALARMVEAKDGCTGDHCSRLSYLSKMLGAQLGLNEQQQNALSRGGVLHDIGKMGIPDHILMKNGPLSDEEWVTMKTHTTIGAHLCAGLKSMQLTYPIILHHHERWDGGGYPHGLVGEEIPLLARVFQTVDIYDALANERPYKKALHRDEVIRIMEEEVSKGWRDPEISHLFLKIVRETPELLNAPKSDAPTQGEEIFNRLTIHQQASNDI
ncbi:MAG: response regulator [Pseudomonadales bacterium]|nr:response regulator [Pseudomonadales bacterium]